MDSEPITSADLTLVPIVVDDAEEMAEVLGAAELYEFIGGRPPSALELRERYTELAVGHSDDGLEEWFNWVVRRREDGRAVGTVQATVTDAGRRAEVAWVIGLPWQGRGLASRAARVMVEWLEHRGALRITAHVHPEHAASQRVARAVGLTPSDDFVDGERRWTNAPAARPHVLPQGRAGLGPASATAPSAR